MKRLFVARQLPLDVEALAGAEIDVRIWPEPSAPPRERLIAELSESDAAVVLLSDTIDAELLDQCPRLQVVANYAVGYDNIEVEAATARGVWVTNTPDVLTEATADLTWALILGVARRVREGERLIREEEPWRWAPEFLLGKELHRSTLGVVGLGRIGQAVSRRARGFGMRVLAHQRSEISVAIQESMPVQPVDLNTLLEESDVVSIHCPLTPETHHLFGEAELQRMKSDAILINTARGPIVDEAALAEALQAGEIGGAGLDVFEREPEVRPELLRCENAMLLPHLGSATEATRRRMAEIAVGNAIAVLQGKIPTHPINQPSSGRE